MSEDYLSAALASFDLDGALYCRAEARTAWAVAVRSTTRAHFHYVERGGCQLRADDLDAPLELRQGDLVLFPRGTGHTVGQPLGTPAMPIERVLDLRRDGGYAVAYGDGEHRTTLVCGYLELGSDHDHPLLRALPSMLLIRAAEEPQLTAALTLLAHETTGGSLGAATIATRLAEVAFFYMVRTWAADLEADAGWVGALRHPRIGRAMVAFYERPADRWSVDTLSRIAGMSRAAFAREFCELLGEPPMRHLTGWRMRLARHYLERSELPTSIIAERVGYSSPEALSRAFKRHFGRPPTSQRAGGTETSH